MVSQITNMSSTERKKRVIMSRNFRPEDAVLSLSGWMRRTETSTCLRTSTNFSTRRWWLCTRRAGSSDGGTRPATRTVSSSWRRSDRLVQVCVTDDDVPEDLRDRILRLMANREARKKRAERTRM